MLPRNTLASPTLRIALFPFHVRSTRHTFAYRAYRSFPSSNTETAYARSSSTRINTFYSLFFSSPHVLFGYFPVVALKTGKNTTRPCVVNCAKKWAYRLTTLANTCGPARMSLHSSTVIGMANATTRT